MFDDRPLAHVGKRPCCIGAVTQSFGEGSHTECALAPRAGQSGDQRGSYGISRRGLEGRAADRRAFGARRARGTARRGAGDDQGQRRSSRSHNDQRTTPPARAQSPGRQPRCRQSAPCRRNHHRPHQHAGLFPALVHTQQPAWAYAQSQGSIHHSRRLVRRSSGSRRGRHWRHRTWYRHRGLDTLSRLCVRYPRPASLARAHPCHQLHGARSPHRRAAHGRIGSVGANGR